MRALAVLSLLLVCGTAGAATVRPTLDPGWSDAPVQWSSDGSRILYAAVWDAPKSIDYGVALVGRDGSPDPRLSPPRSIDETYESGAQLSPDGRQLLVRRQPDALNTGDVVVVVRTLATGSDTAVTSTDQVDKSGEGWSPDGSRVLVIVDKTLLSERPDGTDEHRVTPEEVVAARYLRDGSIVVERSTAREYWIGVVPAAGGAVRRLTPNGDWALGAPSPDGKRVLVVRGAVNSNSPKLVVLDIASGREQQIAGSAYGTWSPDGRRVAYARADGIHVVGADGSADRRIRATGEAPVWSPRSDLMVFADDGECNENGIFTMRPDGSGVRRLTQVCRLVGTSGPDTIAGTNSRDVIRGLGGNDRIDANPGNRIKPYYGIPDADDVEGGPGDDTIDVRDGWVSRDHVRCGSGVDRVVADRVDVVARDCEHVARR